ncbi:MAG TPA: ATP-binding protein [Bacteroidota bacterium]|nr:ATP-binding protein [Bacteroidota bacterium]
MGKDLHRKPTVLVVDDDDKFCTFTREALSGEGVAVTTALTGQTAIDACNNDSFDLVLLDLKLPDMNGKDVFKSVREHSPATDVMIVTGNKNIDVAVDLLKLGAKEYITKPVDPPELIQRVKSALRSRTAEQRLKHLQSEFMSRLLHDIRSPLSTMGSTLDYLKSSTAGKITQPQQLLLENMKSSVNQMNMLLSDIIDFTLLESGNADIEKLPTNLDELLPAICDQHKSKAGEKNITISFKNRGNIPTLEADAARLEQVFGNLIDNAIRYTTNGGSITITLSPVKLPLSGHDRESVEITVADTGAGIPKEEQPLLFDQYKDILLGKSSHKRTTGLGLAICRSIIEAHNGTITVESEPGKGSTFRILLPAEM